jgi:hypothetical protein
VAEKHILYFTAEGHSLLRCSRGRLELEASFTPDEDGVGQFREHLRDARRGTLYAVVADLAGEDFHEDQIPALRGSDREAIVQRRLAQRYRDTRLAAALSLGTADAGGRRNERILLASFTNTQQIAPWLDALDAAGARLAGVYSVPLAAPALAARLGIRTGRAFLITSNRAGLRQSFIEDGRLRFARLERTGEMSPQALAVFVRSETQRLAQYLSTLRVLPRNEGPVQVLVVAPPGQRAAFERELVSDARLVFRTVDGSDAARAAGLAARPAEVLAEALYLTLVARTPPREQFANRADRRRFHVWRLQRAVVAAGLAGFAACAVVAGSRWLEAGDLHSRAETQRQQGAAAADQYARITAQFPVTQTTTENLKVAVVEFTRLAQRNALPEETFVHVSRVLQQFPQMELDALVWSTGRGPDRRDARPAAPVANPARQAAAAITVELSGRVNAMKRDDFRGITSQVQQFAGALGGSGYEVLATRLPFDITSEGTLTGDIGGSTDEAPRFTVILTRSLP